LRRLSIKDKDKEEEDAIPKARTILSIESSIKNKFAKALREST
jgi:hypothetical protein